MNSLYFFAIIGPISLVLGIVTLVNRVKFVLNSNLVVGTVIDTKEKRMNNGKYYYPVIEYYDIDSKSREIFESDTGYNPPKYSNGDNVQLRYYKGGGKKEVRVNTWFAIWGGTALLIPIGVLFSTIGVNVIFYIKP